MVLTKFFAVFRVKPGRADDYVAASAFEGLPPRRAVGASIGAGGISGSFSGARVAEICAET